MPPLPDQYKHNGDDQEAVREGFRARPDGDDRLDGPPVNRQNGNERADDKRQPEPPAGIGGGIGHRRWQRRHGAFGLRAHRVLAGAAARCRNDAGVDDDRRAGSARANKSSSRASRDDHA